MFSIALSKYEYVILGSASVLLIPAVMDYIGIPSAKYISLIQPIAQLSNILTSNSVVTYIPVMILLSGGVLSYFIGKKIWNIGK